MSGNSDTFRQDEYKLKWPVDNTPEESSDDSPPPRRTLLRVHRRLQIVKKTSSSTSSSLPTPFSTESTESKREGGVVKKFETVPLKLKTSDILTSDVPTTDTIPTPIKSHRVLLEKDLIAGSSFDGIGFPKSLLRDLDVCEPMDAAVHEHVWSDQVSNWSGIPRAHQQWFLIQSHHERSTHYSLNLALDKLYDRSLLYLKSCPTPNNDVPGHEQLRTKDMVYYVRATHQYGDDDDDVILSLCMSPETQSTVTLTIVPLPERNLVIMKYFDRMSQRVRFIGSVFIRLIPDARIEERRQRWSVFQKVMHLLRPPLIDINGQKVRRYYTESRHNGVLKGITEILYTDVQPVSYCLIIIIHDEDTRDMTDAKMVTNVSSSDDLNDHIGRYEMLNWKETGIWRNFAMTLLAYYTNYTTTPLAVNVRLAPQTGNCDVFSSASHHSIIQKDVYTMCITNSLSVISGPNQIPTALLSLISNYVAPLEFQLSCINESSLITIFPKVLALHIGCDVQMATNAFKVAGKPSELLTAAQTPNLSTLFYTIPGFIREQEIIVTWFDISNLQSQLVTIVVASNATYKTIAHLAHKRAQTIRTSDSTTPLHEKDKDNVEDDLQFNVIQVNSFTNTPMQLVADMDAVAVHVNGTSLRIELRGGSSRQNPTLSLRTTWIALYVDGLRISEFVTICFDPMDDAQGICRRMAHVFGLPPHLFNSCVIGWMYPVVGAAGRFSIHECYVYGSAISLPRTDELLGIQLKVDTPNASGATVGLRI